MPSESKSHPKHVEGWWRKDFSKSICHFSLPVCHVQACSDRNGKCHIWQNNAQSKSEWVLTASSSVVIQDVVKMTRTQLRNVLCLTRPGSWSFSFTYLSLWLSVTIAVWLHSDVIHWIYQHCLDWTISTIEFSGLKVGTDLEGVKTMNPEDFC